MNRLDRIQIITEKHGVSLPEYVVLDVISNFSTNAEEAAGYASKILRGSRHEHADCDAAVAHCVAKSWLEQRGPVLVLTRDGSALRQEISNDVRRLERAGGGGPDA